MMTGVEATLSRADFDWITAALVGSPSSPHTDSTVLDSQHPWHESIVVTDTITGFRFALCSDSSRIHAVRVPDNIRTGVYTARSGYQLATGDGPDSYRMLVRKVLDAQLDAYGPRRPVTAKVASCRLAEIKRLLDEHPDTVAALRTRAISLHDENNYGIAVARIETPAYVDRTRGSNAAYIRARTLRRVLSGGMSTFTATGPLSPLLAFTAGRHRIALLMPRAEATEWGYRFDTAGLPQELVTTKQKATP